MANDKKVVKEVASCIRVLLKTEGTSAKVKDIVELIKDEDLSNPVALKDKIGNDMRAKQDAEDTKPKRRDHIKAFMVENFTLIKDNPIVLDTLVKSYCQGRLKKDRRNELAAELLDACKSQPVVETESETKATSDFDF